MENNVHSERKSLSESIQRMFYSSWFRIVFAFVLGVLVGVFIVILTGQNHTYDPVKKQDASGTMWDSRPFDQMTVADNLLFQNQDINASFDVRYSTRIVEAHIGLSSADPVKVALSFDPNAFKSFVVQNVNVNEQTTAYSSYSSVQINNAGDNQFVVLLYNRTDLSNKIYITILQNDNPVYSNSVTINKN